MDTTASQFDFDQVTEGMERRVECRVDDEKIDSFACLSGDCSPIHMDSDFAKMRGFKGRVAHGLLLGAVVSRLVGMLLPGENALLQQVQLTFHSPVYGGDQVSVIGIVARKSEAVRSIQVSIRVECKGIVVASGKVQVGFTC